MSNRLMSQLTGLSLFITILGGCGQAKKSSETAKERYRIVSNLRIPMRDGIRLAADVWLPRNSGKYPVLVWRTPYGKELDAEDNVRTLLAAVDRGYAVLVNDVRGRYGSEGIYAPYVQERKDGYDVVEWAAKQEWSDGNIGMIGVSYRGAVQWLAAIEAPPSLKAIAPGMSFASMRYFIYYNGVLDNSWPEWIYTLMSPDANTRGDFAGPKTYDDAENEFKKLGGLAATAKALPLKDLSLLKEAGPYWYDWMGTPPESAAWDFGEVADSYSKVRAAVLNLSGWYDGAYGSDGAIRAFSALTKLRNAPPTKLIMGPWIHSASNVEKTKAGDRAFGDNAVGHYDDTILDWMDRHVKGLRGKSEPRARIYLMGSNQWILANSWPLPGVVEETWHLGRKKEAKLGTLALARVMEEMSTGFRSDPAKPVEDPQPLNMGAFDRRWLLNREDVATFETDTLDRDLSVVGEIKLQLAASADARDFDLIAMITDVAPDGTAFDIGSLGAGVLRASYREKGAKKLLEPNEAVTLSMGQIYTANTFKKGHRLRISLVGSWHPYYARNLQTGDSEITSSKTQAATITIHHDKLKISKVILPVLR